MCGLIACLAGSRLCCWLLDSEGHGFSPARSLSCPRGRYRIGVFVAMIIWQELSTILGMAFLPVGFLCVFGFIFDSPFSSFFDI